VNNYFAVRDKSKSNTSLRNTENRRNTSAIFSPMLGYGENIPQAKNEKKKVATNSKTTC
jgi:hypothetical protein